MVIINRFAPDANPAALSDSIEGQSAVRADRLAGRRDNRPRTSFDVPGQKLGKRPFADEADAGAVPLLRYGQPGLGGQRSDLRLQPVSEREQHAFEVPTMHGVQEIALILLGIACLEQQRTAGGGLEPRVVSGSEASGSRIDKVLRASIAVFIFLLVLAMFPYTADPTGDIKILLPKRASTKKFLPNVYELPGGHIDFGEDIADGGT